MKRKILFLISSNLFVRNYITSQSLASLYDSFEIDYLVFKDIDFPRAAVLPSNIYTYNISALTRILQLQLFKYTSLHNIDKSKSFQFRLNRFKTLRLDSIKNDIASLATNPFIIFKLVLKVFRYIANLILEVLLRYKLFYKLSTSLLSLIAPEIKDISIAIRNSKPDLIILPSSAYDIEFSTLVSNSHYLGIPIFLLVDNWDNLTSKTVLRHLPDWVGVWGEQSKKHAIEIQSIRDSRVICIGTPRYEPYFLNRDEDLASNFEFKYILFLGTSLPFDEFNVLNKLNSIVSDNDFLSSNYKIVYRPHPWRQSKKYNDLSVLANVVIDPQLINQYHKANSSVKFQPDINYYPSLLQNSSLIIGGLTSMLIEATIMYKNYLVLAHEDPTVYESPKLVYRSYTHFEDINLLPNLSICNQLSELSSLILAGLSMQDKVNKKEIDRMLKYFLYFDELSYSERLLLNCKKILSQRY